MTDKKQISLKVVGQRTIHCSGCENTVKYALSQIPGVEQIRADHKTQLIEFDLTSEVADLDKVKAELEWIGYQAELA
jgi:copper chaperone CopZ